MAKKYKFYPIKTVKGVDGEDWDIYEEIMTSVGIILCKGWRYGTRGGQFRFILTSDVAEYIKKTGLYEAMDGLGVSDRVIGRFRRELDIQRKWFVISPEEHEWSMLHKDELLNKSYSELQQKYSLNQTTVARLARHLLYLGESRQREVRQSDKSYEIEQFYQSHKNKIVEMTIQEIMNSLKCSETIAKKIYSRAYREKITVHWQRNNSKNG
ncbi:hypothetical protein F971_00409 [Acinetobacter vivianii]|uniref:Uncharacterized protein n=1 Tax=Acinetobacter vivianii TaxID=1776742 RepID=N8V2B2_9GAMM|nr:hypothetical protein [Acinetobacter vivianii]ENU93971.1 hypothetical protein F971_00409 [Acinetobacter vivianii]